MAKYELTERSFIDLRIMEPGEIVEIPDDQIPGRTWEPYGPGPHREWQHIKYRSEEYHRYSIVDERWRGWSWKAYPRNYVPL